LPIPDLQNDGLLPAGVHDCTLSELVSKFNFTPHRVELLGRFRGLLTQLPPLVGVRYLLVDGSFVEDRPEPHDIDVVLAVESLSDGTPGADLLKWVAVRHNSVKAIFNCDLYVDDEIGIQGYWTRLFGMTRSRRPKGMLRVMEGWGDSRDT
jgi:hypothetical protein